MHDDDEPLTGYEDRLRDALHRVPTPDSDPDAVLARVEHGVRRRVRRRRIGTASLGVAAVLAAAAVVVPGFYDGSSDVADPNHGPGTPSQGAHQGHGQHKGTPMTTKGKPEVKTPKATDPDPAGKVTDPNGIAVSGVATNDSGAVSVIGESTCPDGPCVVTGSPKGSKDYRIAPTDDRLTKMSTSTTETAATGEPGIQVGSDPANSWAWTDGFYSTHDAGRTWRPVDLPTSLKVEDVESAERRVWAFGTRDNGRAAVASSAENSDHWVDEPVPVHADETIDTPMIVDNRVAFVATERYSAKADLVRQRGTGWARHSVPCPEPVKSSGASGTVWLGCRTPNGSDYVAWSHNGGSKWNYEMVDQPGLSAVGGVDKDTAVAAAGDDLLVVDSGGKTHEAATPFDESDPVWDGTAGYESIRISDDGTGYATTNGGALARTDDGGHTWQAEKLP